MKVAHAPPGHHSIVGCPSTGGLNYAEYVIYRGEQAYPEYLITYLLVPPDSNNIDTVENLPKNVSVKNQTKLSGNGTISNSNQSSQRNVTSTNNSTIQSNDNLSNLILNSNDFISQLTDLTLTNNDTQTGVLTSSAPGGPNNHTTG